MEGQGHTSVILVQILLEYINHLMTGRSIYSYPPFRFPGFVYKAGKNKEQSEKENPVNANV
jgi:hypothetical protein